MAESAAGGAAPGAEARPGPGGPAEPYVEFVNHASVLLSDGRTGVLSDPWYFGEVFHRGWSLLVENRDEAIRRVLSRTTHIWISHEHPDHFSPPFFKRYAALIRERGITVLFQATRDGRVAAFLREQGFAVLELGAAQTMQLGPEFSVRVVQSDLYDSALLADIAGLRVFNLNDCPLGSHDKLERFVRRHGGCDVLLTQFSYAAWKGGHADRAWRERAARGKREAMRRQIQHLRPQACIAFASFVRFSHVLNGYMNDSVNVPAQVAAEFAGLPCELVFMRPGEIQPLAGLRQDRQSLAYWQEKYDVIGSQPQARYSDARDLGSLHEDFAAYRQRIARRNSRWMMWAARRLLPQRPFAPTWVRLIDLQMTVRVDVLEGSLAQDPDAPADVALHSCSLAFVFRHDFGLDTLVVNGCFEESSPQGFQRFAKALAIGNLNAMGVYLGPAIVRHLGVVGLLLGKLLSVRRNVARRR